MTKHRDSLAARARAHGVNYHTVITRLRLGWTEDRALTTPRAQDTRRRKLAALRERLREKGY